MHRFKKLISSSKTKIDDEIAWHRRLRAIATQREIYLDGGDNNRITDLEALQKVTDAFLSQWKSSLGGTVSEDQLDRWILQLVEKHVVELKGCLETAVLACGHVCSTAVAAKLLTLLQVLDCSRYLGFLLNSTQLFKQDGIVNETERAVAANLLTLLSVSSDRAACQFANHMAAFKYIVLNLHRLVDSILLPIELVNKTIASSPVRTLHSSYICDLTTQRRYRTVYDQVSWLNTMFPSIPAASRELSIGVLDANFPSWPLYQHWRPDYDRVCRWENSHLTEAQRKELFYIFDLDGPDIIDKRRATLQVSINYSVPGKTAELLGRLVVGLDRAIETGSEAIDTFISGLVDLMVTDKDGLATMFETNMTAAGMHWSCSTILALRRALNESVALLERMEAFSTALSRFPVSFIPTDQSTVGRIARAAQETVAAAQAVFSAQLEDTGVGEVYGMAIFDMFAALRECSWLRPCLERDFVSMLEVTEFQFVVTRDMLETAFECFEDSRNRGVRMNYTELHSFMVLLGTQALTDTDRGSLIHVPNDLRFWSSRPGTDRADLAGLISRVENVSYELYVSCLTRMLDEEDLMIRDIVPSFRLSGLGGARILARRLIRRRDFGRPVHECWSSLLVCMIQNQTAACLIDLAKSLQDREFLCFVEDVPGLVGIDNPALEAQGGAISRHRLAWWAELLGNHKPALEFLLGIQDNQDVGNGGSKWFLFFEGAEAVRCILDLCREPASLGEPERILVGCLHPDGSNVSDISRCLEEMRRLSSEQIRTLCQRLILRSQPGRKETWPRDAVSGLLGALELASDLSDQDKGGLELIGNALGIRPIAEGDPRAMAYDLLSQEYDLLSMEAQELELLRSRLQLHDPEHMTALLARIGIHGTDGRSARLVDPDVPERLLDVVEVIDREVYELCFALTGLSELQRRARGAPRTWRAVVVRVSHWRRFCIHPVDDADLTVTRDHVGWDCRQPRPCQGTCGVDLNLFSYGLAGAVHVALQSHSLQTIHDTVAAFITDPPSQCIVCHVGNTPRRWRPTACSQICLAALTTIPPHVSLQFLVIDSLALDFLLTSVYLASTDPCTMSHLSGCPVPRAQLPAVIDSFPPLSGASTARDVHNALRAAESHSRVAGASMGSQRESLLVWLLFFFQGFIATTPSNRRIPSMPHTIQFSVLDLAHSPSSETHSLYGSSSMGHANTNTNTNVVFHGTRPSRFLSIFQGGLMVMSGTSGQINGAAQGPGVYCGDDPVTSLPYCGTTGSAWRNSKLKNRRLLLACEMKGYTAPGPGKIHVVTNPAGGAGLAVRWIFLLPEGRFQCPERRHVEIGLRSGFRWIREGM
ncbi:hypothetical protein QBC37DRAFT_456928 [Rhypophila decipiens]|uniref:PARP catalytic domain-containing protein n=1 Tax=Rhypophila decipiens TaxID=261697 RepID=A0AAN6XUM4_9PEZI|nr:hypothetical protein QBC37DRAFT_456928 [Rhypophila decipiens]